MLEVTLQNVNQVVVKNHIIYINQYVHMVLNLQLLLEITEVSDSKGVKEIKSNDCFVDLLQCIC